ncbi:aminotransferase class V-fold PLP-dependent enzyme [uncultured Thiodictyon sp.]|jgi:cysteine desulfurase|uniref:aminotransferase class V-fold PLP-dependent enzyme n=1 Tax=uncultured Thiodictyon sp. TaxID=1846217 RepID=UPI0025F1D21A|nr:aminotransferase class V-fold PLP-dependent enzyme [uncultured Thiodictyon sp.]
MSPVYLDCNATTPLDPAVRKVLLHFLDEDFGNEGSRTHAFGARAKQAVQRARDQVAAVVGARRDEVVFTSGATESNNPGSTPMPHRASARTWSRCAIHGSI